MMGASVVDRESARIEAHSSKRMFAYSELETAFAALNREPVDAMVIATSPFFLTRAKEIAALAARQRVPAIYARREFAEGGGLMSYGYDVADGYRHMGLYAGRILKGERREVAHTEDLRTQPPYLEGDPAIVNIADLAGARTIVNVPMVKDGQLIGAVSIFRQEVRPFTDKQIALVQNFAHPESALGRAALTKQVAHIDDIRTSRAYRDGDPRLIAGVELGGYRTVLSVPMLKDQEVVGLPNNECIIPRRFWLWAETLGRVGRACCA
jgi:hypothetical protein